MWTTNPHASDRLAVVVLVVCLYSPVRAELNQPPLPMADSGTTIPLYLELVINGRASGEVVEVRQRADHYEIEAGVLHRFHVLRQAATAERVAVDTVPGVRTQYDSLNQRLLIDVPPEWLPSQQIAGNTRRPRVEAISSTGILLNYDFYSSISRGVSVSSLWSEQRYFSPQGVFSNTGILRHGGSGEFGGAGYLRYDTRWTRTDTDHATEHSVGDVVLGALPWTSAVRLGGIQWSRNFGVRPDLVTYPLPQFAGQAAVPSMVDLFVNDYRTVSRPIDPGPFTFNELPFVNGAGAATVVTTDALGRRVATSLPFYVSTTLLKPGLTDYSASLGKLRRNYGLSSNDYGQPLAAGVLRHGWRNWATIEAQGQFGRGLTVAGIGAVFQPGTYGTFSTSLSHGKTPASNGGVQVTAGYQYNTQRGGFNVQQTVRQSGYGDASSYGNDAYQLYRQQRQITGNVALGTGALSAGMIDLQSSTHSLTAGASRSRVAYVSYSRPVGESTYLAVSVSRAIDTGENQLRLQLTVSLDRRTNAYVSATRIGDDQRLVGGYQQSPPTEGGFGWNFSRSLGDRTGQEYNQGTVQYRGRHALAQGGVYGSTDNLTHWTGASGSLGYLGGRAFATNRVTDAFAVVATGQAGVPVRFDQQLIGTTDQDGYLLVPQVPGYLSGAYAVEQLDLPPDVQAVVPVQTVAVRGGTGALIELPVHTVESATIHVQDAQNTPLRLGTTYRHVEAGVDSVVGWDGLVYLPQLMPINTLQMHSSVGSCHVRFSAAQYRNGERTMNCIAGKPAP